MAKVSIMVKKHKCKTACPLPLTLLPNVADGVTKVVYHDGTETADVTYDPKRTNPNKIKAEIRRLTYDVS